MGFLSDQGALALASRLKVLGERCYDLLDQVYAEHGIALQARWFPLLRMLQLRGDLYLATEAAPIYVRCQLRREKLDDDFSP